MRGPARSTLNLVLFLCALAFIIVGFSLVVTVGGIGGPLALIVCLAAAFACNEAIR